MGQLKRSVRTPLLKKGLHISQPAATPKADTVSDIEDDYERDPESEPESQLGDAPKNTLKQKAEVGVDRKNPVLSGQSNNRRNATTRSSNPLVSRPMAFRQPNAPRSSAGNKRKRADAPAPKGWDTAEDLLDDEFTTIREASLPVVAADSPDQLDSIEFGSNLLGSQKTTYARSSQSSSQTMSNIHAKTGSQKPRQKKSKDFKIAFKNPGAYNLPADETQPTTAFIPPRSRGVTPPKETLLGAKFRLPLAAPALPDYHDIVSSSPLPTLSSPLSTPPRFARNRHDEDELASSLSTTSSPTSSVNLTHIPCPICEMLVERTLYNAFLAKTGQNKLNTKSKLRFCESHKAAKAQERFKSADYPTVNWNKLPGRLDKMDSIIEDILFQRTYSTYRARLQEAIGDEATNFRHVLRNPDANPAGVTEKTADELVTAADLDELAALTENDIAGLDRGKVNSTGLRFGIAGYYGARGAQMIMDHVISSTHLSQKLREISANERVFKSVGVSGFVQAVIIPEIAWRLVREDLNLGSAGRRGRSRKGATERVNEPEEGEERAKQILVESWEVGELVNAEEESEIRQIQELSDDDDA